VQTAIFAQIFKVLFKEYLKLHKIRLAENQGARPSVEARFLKRPARLGALRTS